MSKPPLFDASQRLSLKNQEIHHGQHAKSDQCEKVNIHEMIPLPTVVSKEIMLQLISAEKLACGIVIIALLPPKTPPFPSTEVYITNGSQVIDPEIQRKELFEAHDKKCELELLKKSHRLGCSQFIGTVLMG